jgi:tetratricopeptide (TPR) repeat protein
MSQLEAPQLTADLLNYLGHRRIREGLALLQQAKPIIESLRPTPGSGVLLGLISQWIDAGFEGSDLIECLLARFPKTTRASLPLADYVHLRMVEGFLAMSKEDLDSAAAHFQLVLGFESEIDDPEMFAIANFWLGRAYRKKGRYQEALEYTERGERLALDLAYTEMAAIMQVTLSWLCFQKGKLHEATRILRRAEQALNHTDDFVSRGNCQSAYGRIARRQGKCELAVERFEHAILEFRQAGGGMLALARTLVNLAFVKRLLAGRAQKDLDSIAASRRGTSHRPAPPAGAERHRIEQVRAEARECLAEASEIYGRHQIHSGLAAVRITQGFLHLDSGDLESAAAEAAEAFHLAGGKSDYIVMARARTLECIIENTAIEEQLGDHAQHRDAAEIFAREAVAFAGRTENRRLLARALVWQGLTFTLEPADSEAARRCCDQAMALLQPEGLERQYVWDDLETLKMRVLHTQSVDAVLRTWSAGIVEGRTFQQLTEEFARMVIPRVWEREGCKVSRVADKLSISPKKVRRLLRAAGVAKTDA